MEGLQPYFFGTPSGGQRQPRKDFSSHQTLKGIPRATRSGPICRNDTECGAPSINATTGSRSSPAIRCASQNTAAHRKTVRPNTPGGSFDDTRTGQTWLDEKNVATQKYFTEQATKDIPEVLQEAALVIASLPMDIDFSDWDTMTAKQQLKALEFTDECAA
jgi:hypothetical protein